jgi:hypothetical protein
MPTLNLKVHKNLLAIKSPREVVIMTSLPAGAAQGPAGAPGCEGLSAEAARAPVPRVYELPPGCVAPEDLQRHQH